MAAKAELLTAEEFFRQPSSDKFEASRFFESS